MISWIIIQLGFCGYVKIKEKQYASVKGEFQVGFVSCLQFRISLLDAPSDSRADIATVYITQTSCYEPKES